VATTMMVMGNGQARATVVAAEGPMADVNRLVDRIASEAVGSGGRVKIRRVQARR